MIVFDQVWVRFPKNNGFVNVLQDVSVTFETGRSIGILGGRGSGKSTVIRLIARSLTPDHGHIEHHGTVSWPVTSQRPLVPTLPVRTNIRFIASLYNIPAPDLIRQVAREADLALHMDDLVRDLPREVRSRVVYTLCLAVGFDFYIADDGLFIGDEEFREKSNLYLQKMRDKHTVILASRHASLIRRHCEVVFLLEGGRLRKYDDPKEAFRVYRDL
jgi:capsular polysaccharide transport system ATP-binding protein